MNQPAMCVCVVKKEEEESVQGGSLSGRLCTKDVAGATLLALGGAAPDVFTQASALLEGSSPDVRLALSESIGAGAFVSTFCLACAVGLQGSGTGSDWVATAYLNVYSAPAVQYNGIVYMPHGVLVHYNIVVKPLSCDP